MIIHDECSSNVKDLAVIDRILAPHRDGLPAVLLHCGMHSYRSEGYPTAVTPWFEFTGLQSTGHGPQAPIDISFVAPRQPDHQGPGELDDDQRRAVQQQRRQAARHGHGPGPRQADDQEQARARRRRNDYVVAWTNNYSGTKVFATTLGHNNQTVADPRYLDLVTRGLLWSCGKLNDQYLKPAAAR